MLKIVTFTIGRKRFPNTNLITPNLVTFYSKPAFMFELSTNNEGSLWGVTVYSEIEELLTGNSFSRLSKVFSTKDAAMKYMNGL